MATEKAAILRAKKEQSIQSMKFNRFLWFRYATAGMFFVNLYWMILLIGLKSFAWLLPAALLVVYVAVTVEQTRKYWHATRALPLTKAGYLIQILINIAVLVSVLSGAGHVFFPFFVTTKQSAILLMLTFGIILALWIERRAWLVEHNQDKYLDRLRIFEDSLH